MASFTECILIAGYSKESRHDIISYFGPFWLAIAFRVSTPEEILFQRMLHHPLSHFGYALTPKARLNYAHF